MAEATGGISDIYKKVIASFVNSFSRIAESTTQTAEAAAWTPITSISDEQLESYVEKAKNERRYSTEQSLGLLFWHKHDLAAACADMENVDSFTVRPNKWTDFERLEFHQGYQTYGAELRLIQLNKLPTKGMAQLVQFYYNWQACLAELKAQGPRSYMISRRRAMALIREVKEPEVIVEEEEEPEVKEEKPEIKEEKPKTKEEKPKIKEEKPKIKEEKPKIMVAKPAIKKEEPKLKEKIEPKAKETLELKIKKIEPEIKKEEPEIRKKEPEIRKKEPEIKKKEPEIRKKEPEIKKEEPEIRKKEPEIKKEELEIKEKEELEIKMEKLEIKEKPVTKEGPKLN